MSTTTLKLTPEAGDSTLTQRWLEEARETGETDTFTRRHRDPRTTWGDPLEVQVFKGPGCWLSCRATARDISAGGVGFQCREPIPPWTPVLVCRAGEAVGAPAMVANCTPGVSCYVIGAEFRFENQVAQKRAAALAG